MKLWRGTTERMRVFDMAKKDVKSTIHAKDVHIKVLSRMNQDDFISLTDIAKYRDAENPRFIIQNWMRNRNTVFFLGLWETINNPNFNRVEFEAVKNEAGLNGFVLTPQKWIKLTNAKGITSKAGRYDSGTFAHKDIAFEFASWLSPEFKLYIIQDYQRLKQDESHRLELDWNVKRILASANYKIHTDAIKENLIPESIAKGRQGFIYATEADLLNAALFGKTAKEWRKANPELDGNMRDYATIEQLLVMTNLENMNALLIKQGLSQEERVKMLNEMAIDQMTKLSNSKGAKTLNNLHNQPKMLNDKN